MMDFEQQSYNEKNIQSRESLALKIGRMLNSEVVNRSDTHVKILTMDDISWYLVTAMHNNAEIAGCLIHISRGQSTKYSVMQVMLNKDGEFLYSAKDVVIGRKVIVEKLNDDVIAFMGTESNKILYGQSKGV